MFWGLHYLWGQVQGCQQPLLGQWLAPLAPNSLSSLPMDQAEVVGNRHQMVCFGVLTTCKANFWGAHHFSWTKGPSPCSQCAPLTPNGPTEVGGNGVRGVCFGTQLPVGASFGVPTTSVGPRLAPLAPNSLPSLPMDQAEVAGNGHQMVCFGVPTTCGANFLGCPPLLLNQESLLSLTID